MKSIDEIAVDSIQYKSFPDVSPIIIAAMSDDDAQKLHDKIIEIEKFNEDAYKKNLSLFQYFYGELDKFLGSLGIPITNKNKSVKDYMLVARRKAMAKIVGSFPTFRNTIVKHYETLIKSYRLTQQQAALIDFTSVLSFRSTWVKLMKMKADEEKKLHDQEVKTARMHAKALEILKDSGIDASNMTYVETLQKATEITKAAYLQTLEKVDIDICDNCSSYTVGESRCDCGSTRVEIAVDGDILNGFYAYGSRY